jgi:hypothetical protein
MRQKISLAVRRANVARRGGGGFRSVGFRSGGGILGAFRQSFARPTLMKATGAVAASIGTGMILRKFGASLPLSTARYSKAVYSLIIPALAAYFVQRKSRDLAEGLVIGGVVMAITEVIKNSATATSAIGTLGASPSGIAALNGNGFGVAGELGYGAYPVGSDLDTLGAPLITRAFPSSAW